MLEVKELSFSYSDGSQKKQVLDHVNVKFESGVFYTILGRSGSGKTTLLALLSALDEAQSGQILLDDIPIEKIGLSNYRRNKIGIVFQSFQLIPYMNALQNVMVAIGITQNENGGKKEAIDLLASLGIDFDKATRPINKLSGGEQQRVAIARTLATNVDIILADEPTGNLDKKTQKEIISIFQELAHDRNKCVIVVTHSHEVAKGSDIIYKMNDGKLE